MLPSATQSSTAILIPSRFTREDKPMTFVDAAEGRHSVARRAHFEPVRKRINAWREIRREDRAHCEAPGLVANTGIGRWRPIRRGTSKPSR